MKSAVLLAAWNGEPFLPALLNSLEQQADHDFQVLYQDDGSGDGTVSLLSAVSFRDSRYVSGTESGKKLGAVGNFMSLLRQTDADRIFFCDQDDIWEPDKIAVLKKRMDEAERENGAGVPILIHSDCSVINETGDILYPSFFRLQGWDPRATTLAPLLVQNNATGCTMLLNRPLADLIRRYGNPEKMFMHDWFAVLTAAAFGRVYFVEQPLTRYRQHQDNTIGASRSSLLRRSWNALLQGEKARERIALTYSHTQAFWDACGDALPAGAARTVNGYLATRSMPKRERIREIRRLGCVMQSPLTRAGQILFG